LLATPSGRTFLLTALRANAVAKMLHTPTRLALTVFLARVKEAPGARLTLHEGNVRTVIEEPDLLGQLDIRLDNLVQVWFTESFCGTIGQPAYVLATTIRDHNVAGSAARRDHQSKHNQKVFHLALLWTRLCRKAVLRASWVGGLRFSISCP